MTTVTLPRSVLALWLITVASTIQASEFKVDGIVIDVPASFKGPVSAQSDTTVRTYAFTIPGSNALAPATVLQISVHKSAEDSSGRHSADVPQQCLSQMLRSIERHRTEYQETASMEIQLAGYTGAVASWQGKANGIEVNGRLFCILAGSERMYFHVMGGGNAPNPDMRAAIQAVVNARKY